MERDASGGCQTFDQSLLKLFSTGMIDKEVAMANADYPNNLRLELQNGSPELNTELTLEEPEQTEVENTTESWSSLSKLSLLQETGHQPRPEPVAVSA